MWGDDAVREGNLQGTSLLIGGVAGVVSAPRHVHRQNQAIASPDHESVICPMRQRDMRNTGQEYDNPGHKGGESSIDIPAS